MQLYELMLSFRAYQRFEKQRIDARNESEPESDSWSPIDDSQSSGAGFLMKAPADLPLALGDPWPCERRQVNGHLSSCVNNNNRI